MAGQNYADQTGETDFYDDAPATKWIDEVSNYLGITGGGISTTTTLSAVPTSPQMVGTSIAFTATVSPSAATGTVQFFDGSTLLGSAILSGGTCNFSTSGLTVATHSITANYGGDATYDLSYSSALSYTITAGAGLSTSTIIGGIPPSPITYGTLITLTAQVTSTVELVTLTTTPNPTTFGGSVGLTATLSSTPDPTGTVNFYDGATLIGSGTLAGGAASFALAPSLGAHSFTADYLGDSTYAGSSSAPLAYAVTAPVVTDLPLTGVGMPVQGVQARRTQQFTYDRPYLAEHAAQLRRAMRRKKPAEVREVIRAIIDQPATPPVVVEAAAPLTNVRSLKVNIMKGLYALLDEIERELECEEEDSEMLLLS